MTYLNYSVFCRSVVLSTLTLIFSSGASLAAFEAAPYTVEALQRIDKAALKVPPILAPKALQQADEETKKSGLVKAIYTYWEDLYKQAGYSFEQSLIQLSKDLGADPNFAQNNPLLMATAFRTTFSAYAQLANINSQELVVANYLPSSVGEAFIKIIRVEEEQRKTAEDRKTFESEMRERQSKKQQELRAEAERKQKETEAAARQKAIESQIETERLAQERRTADQDLRDKEKELVAALELKRLQGIAGRFVTDLKRQNKPLGQLEIKLDTAGTMLVNGYDNTYGNKSPELNCQFNDTPLELKFTTADRTEMIMRDAQDSKCEMTLIFSSPLNGLTFAPRGGCRSYCKVGDGTIINHQWKRVGP